MAGYSVAPQTGCTLAELATSRNVAMDRAQKEAEMEREREDEQRIRRALDAAGATGYEISGGVARFEDGTTVAFDRGEGALVVTVVCPACNQHFSAHAYSADRVVDAAALAYRRREQHNAGPEAEPEQGDYLDDALRLLGNSNGNEATYLQGIGLALTDLVKELRLHRS